MGFWSSVGNGISDGASWVGDQAHGAKEWAANKSATVGSVWDGHKAKDVDMPMPDLPGRIDGYPSSIVHFTHWPTCEEIKGPITVTLPFWERGPAQAAPVANTVSGSAATLQTKKVSFLYLDVGRWGGVGDGAKRDFGIVCGRTAALCTFTHGSGGVYGSFPAAVDKLQGDKVVKAEADPINALLSKLQSTPAAGALGPPKVRKWLVADADPMSVAKVYVIVGDMHLPVTTTLNPDGSKPPDNAPPEQTELGGWRVGRVLRGDRPDPTHMLPDDAALWHKMYVAGEVFAQAGKDLSCFVKMLEAAKGQVGAELWLLQLGDMFDMWLGFDCFLQPNPAKDPKNKDRTLKDGENQVLLVPNPAPPPGQAAPLVQLTAKNFVDTWVHRTLALTAESSYVVDFLKFGSDTSMFLYGNHDNYLGAYAPAELTAITGKSGGKSPKQHYDPKAGLFASHGHAWDAYNRDGAVAGVATTQAAFWGGQGIRGWEPEDRKPYLLGSVDMYRKGHNKFCIFAMGHTHTAILAEIIIDYDPVPTPPDPSDYYD